jgi:exopolysaccharide production protein ExoQ
MHSFELGRAKSSTPTIDMCAIVPILACAYAAIVGPLIAFASATAQTPQSMLESGQTNRFFWPAMVAASVVLAARRYSRLSRLTFPPHIICLLAYLALAGASVLWAFKPEFSSIRFVQQVMVVTSILLPAMLADRTTDLMRGLFLCFALASVLNLFFIPSNPTVVVTLQNGYPGYFPSKNQLGEFAALACLVALHEAHHPRFRRALGIFGVLIAISLLFLSNSKTAFGLAVLVPLLARLTLIVRNKTGISIAVLLLFIPFCYFALSSTTGFNMYRISYLLYGDPTFTGRTTIWAFASSEIDIKPLLGWGYQSFWLVGSDAPSVVDAPGWVKSMPNSHNGYYDTMLEMGYVGLALLLIFIVATLHAIGRMADRDPARARLVLSLALYTILYNFLESFWMRGYETLWVVFLIVVAEVGRSWQPLPQARIANRSTTLRSVSPGSSRGARSRGHDSK